MKRCLLLLVLTISAATAGAQAMSASGGILLDSFSAIVNGKVITVGDVFSALQPVQKRLALQYSGDELEQQVLKQYDAVRDSLIESELILLDFEMSGGALPDRAIEDHVNTIIHDEFGNDRAAFLGALAAQRLTFSEWRKQMKEQVIIQIMRQREVTSKILVTPLDLQNAYDRKRNTYTVPERVHLRTLALKRGDTAGEREAALARVNGLRDRLRSGEAAFEDAVTGAIFQDETEFIEIDSLHEDIRRAIATLAPGDIALPLEISGDLYLIQLVERRAAGMRLFEEVASEMERELRRAEFERLNRIWIDSLRAKYYIQTFTHNLLN